MVSLVSPVGMMRPPLQPQRPPIGHKRDSSYIDTDDEAGLSVSTKKLKVAFDDHVDVRILDDWNEKSYELVKEEVRTGIERHLAPADVKDDSQYLQLIQAFSADAYGPGGTSAKLLKKYLLALTGRVSTLKDCGKLVLAILDLPWLGRDTNFVDLYRRFLRDLAVAHARYVPLILERLVHCFARLPASLGQLASESPVARVQMLSRVHGTVQLLLAKLPSASAAVVRAVRDEFPIEVATTRSYLKYIRNLIKLTHYAPELKAEILSVIVQRLVAIDVQIQQDIEDLEDEAEERILQRPSSQNGDAEGEELDDNDEDSVSESEETTTEEERQLRDIRLKVAKMDGTLDILFGYYSNILAIGDQLEVDEAYQQLLSHFTNYILPSRTRHAQFLLFHFTQTSPDFTARFVKRCIELSLHQGGAGTHRLAACAYLASFGARGAHLSSETVRDLFDVLCHYLEDMRHKYEPTCRTPDRRAYSLYYAISQALLYIFCFRWRDLVIGPATPDIDTDGLSEDDLLADGRDLNWLPGIKECLTRNIYSKLNPLKVCSAAIVGEFAKIAHHLRFLYVFPLLETNKRLRLGQNNSYYGAGDSIGIARRETAWDRKTGDAHHQLEAYFPFDPYHLPTSKHWVEGDYNEWKLPTGMRQEEMDEDEEESESEYSSDEESLDDQEVEAAEVDSISS